HISSLSFCNAPATPAIYTLSLHDALPIYGDFGNAENLGPEINTAGNEMFPRPVASGALFFSSDGHPGFGKLDIFVAETKDGQLEDRKSTRLNSSHVKISYAVFCLKKKIKK